MDLAKHLFDSSSIRRKRKSKTMIGSGSTAFGLHMFKLKIIIWFKAVSGITINGFERAYIISS